MERLRKAVEELNLAMLEYQKHGKILPSENATFTPILFDKIVGMYGPKSKSCASYSFYNCAVCGKKMESFWIPKTLSFCEKNNQTIFFKLRNPVSTPWKKDNGRRSYKYCIYISGDDENGWLIVLPAKFSEFISFTGPHHYVDKKWRVCSRKCAEVLAIAIRNQLRRSFREQEEGKLLMMQIASAKVLLTSCKKLINERTK